MITKFAKENQGTIAWGVVILILILLVMYRKNKAAIESGTQPLAGANQEVTTSPFITPYYQTTMLANPTSGNGGPSFASNININLNPSVAQYLNRNYIPTFGFVGMQS